MCALFAIFGIVCVYIRQLHVIEKMLIARIITWHRPADSFSSCFNEQYDYVKWVRDSDRELNRKKDSKPVIISINSISEKEKSYVKCRVYFWISSRFMDELCPNMNSKQLYRVLIENTFRWTSVTIQRYNHVFYLFKYRNRRESLPNVVYVIEDTFIETSGTVTHCRLMKRRSDTVENTITILVSLEYFFFVERFEIKDVLFLFGIVLRQVWGLWSSKKFLKFSSLVRNKREL